MSALRLACPSCKTVLKVGEETRGKAIRCPMCQTAFKVPAAAVAPTTTPAAPPQRTAPAQPAAVTPKPKAPRPPAPAADLAFDSPAAPAVKPKRRASGLRLFSLGCSLLSLLLLLGLAGGGYYVFYVYLPAQLQQAADALKNAKPDNPKPDQPGEPLPPPKDLDPKDGNPDVKNSPTPPVKKTLDTSFITDDFTAAVVAHPKRLLASDQLACLPLDEWLGPVVQIGLDPRQADEVVLLAEPAPELSPPFHPAAVIRFAQPVDARKVLTTLFPTAKERKADDRVYYTLDVPIGDSPLCVHVADDRTVVVAPETLLKKMLSAKGVKSPLIDRLRKIDPEDDVTMVVAVEAMRPLASGAVRQFFETGPPELAEGAALGDEVNAVTVSINLTKDPLFAVDVEAKDEKGAADVLKLATLAHDQLQQHYSDLRGGPLGGVPPDADKLLDDFTGALQKDFTTKAEASHVRMSVKRPAATKELIAKVGPLGPQLLSGPPMAAAKPPRPPHLPSTPPLDVRKLGVAWIKDNNAFGPDDKIVADATTRLTGQVKEKEGFFASIGSKLVKSEKPTLLVGWGEQVFALELTPEQAKQANVAEAAMVVQTIPAADDAGREEPLCKLSDLKIADAEHIDPAAPIRGTVTCQRLRDDNDDYYSLRLSILSRSRIMLFQSVKEAQLPKQGPLTFSFPPLNQVGAAATGPVVALIEVVGRRDQQGFAPPVVLSAPAAGLMNILPQKFGELPPLDPAKAAVVLRQQRYELHADDGQPDRPVVGAFLYSGTLTPEAVQALASIKTLHSLSFYGTTFPEGAIRALQTMTGLEQLSIDGRESDEAALKEIKDLKGLHRLDLNSEHVTDAVVGGLKALTDLEELSLSYGPVTDAGLRELKDLPRLRTLHLMEGKITPAAIKELPNLQGVLLRSTPLTDDSLADLQGLKNLHTLEIQNRGDYAIGDMGLQHIGKMAGLRELTIPIKAGTTDAGWKALGDLSELQTLSVWGGVGSGEWLKQVQGLKALQTLKLSGQDLADAGLEAVAGLPGLQTLWLSGGQCTDEGLKALGKLPHLETLRIARFAKCTGAGLAGLRENKGLRKLGLSGESFGDAAMKEVKGLEGLHFVSLMDTTVTDAGLAELKEINGLEHLTLWSNKTTPAGAAVLRGALPKLEIQTSVRTGIGYEEF